MMRFFVMIAIQILGGSNLAFATFGTFDPPNLLKFRCERTEYLNDQRYLSIIHFYKSTISTRNHSGADITQRSVTYPNIEGEVVSFIANDINRKFISGYSLFAISYNDGVISGLTGDPYTRTDGSFSLTPLSFNFNGMWKFSYTGLNNQSVTAEFHCTYSEKNIEN